MRLHLFRALLLCVAQLLAVPMAGARVSFESLTQVTVEAGFDAGPQAVGLADFNKDGRADIVAVNFFEARVDVFLNDGNGSFGAARTAATLEDPVAVTTADFDRDGNVDMAIVSEFEDAVTVYLGNGSGFFGNRRDFQVDFEPRGVAAADMNGDQLPDLAVLSADTIYVLRNLGEGDFEPFATPSVRTRGDGAYQIVSGFFDSNNSVDLAVSNNGSGNVSVLLGNGDGTFAGAFLQTVGDSPFGLAAGQFGGDPSDDLTVVAGFDVDVRVEVLISNGLSGDDFEFTTEQADFAELDSRALGAIDLDGDTKRDLAVTNVSTGIGVVLYCQQPSILCFDDSPFASPVLAGFQLQPLVGTFGGAAVAVHAGEINGDGRLDLIDLDEDGEIVRVFANTTSAEQPTATSGPGETVTPGAATATPTTSGPTASPTATASPTPTATPRPTATPTRIPTVPYTECNTNAVGQPSVGGSPVDVASGDFDRNGSLDTAVADRGGDRIVILESRIDAAGGDACSVLNLSLGTIISGVQGPVAVVSEDLDRDGRTDLAVAGANGVSVFFGDGEGRFSPSPANPIPAGPSPSDLSVTEFNRDGTPDLLVGDSMGNAAFIFLGTRQRARPFGDGACEFPVGRRPTFVEARDLNQDERADFVVASDQTNDLTVFLQLGGSEPFSCPNVREMFRGLAPIGLRAVPEDIAVGVFSISDTTPDLVVAMSVAGSDGNLQVYAGQLTGENDVIYQQQTPVTVPRPTGSPQTSMPSALGTGDINRDGRLDVIVSDVANNSVVTVIAETDGRLSRADVPEVLSGDAPVGMEVADIDGDGRPDIILANEGDGSVSFLASSRPPATPTPAPTSTATISPTASRTPTLTPTPTATPSQTPTVTPSPTRTPRLTPTYTPEPTATKRGAVQISDSCSIVSPGSSDGGAWPLVLAALAARIRRRRQGR